MYKISIAKEFSPFPIGRKADDGPYNGEKFLNDMLYPKLQEAINNQKVLEIDLDGTLGLTSSFLEEAFAGLIRKKNMDYKSIDKHLRIVTSAPEFKIYIQIINEYIKEAHAKK